MGLIVGYETINGKAHYDITFNLENRKFFNAGEIRNPLEALKIANYLKERGIQPIITRIIEYVKNRYIERNPETENLTLDGLEKIVGNNEEPPSFEKPIIEESIRLCD